MKLFYDTRGVSVLRYFKDKFNQIFKKNKLLRRNDRHIIYYYDYNNAYQCVCR